MLSIIIMGPAFGSEFWPNTYQIFVDAPRTLCTESIIIIGRH